MANIYKNGIYYIDGVPIGTSPNPGLPASLYKAPTATPTATPTTTIPAFPSNLSSVSTPQSQNAQLQTVPAPAAVNSQPNAASPGLPSGLTPVPYDTSKVIPPAPVPAPAPVPVEKVPGQEGYQPTSARVIKYRNTLGVDPSTIPAALQADWQAYLNGDLGAGTRIMTWVYHGTLPAAAPAPVLATPVSPTTAMKNVGLDPNYKSPLTDEQRRIAAGEPQLQPEPQPEPQPQKTNQDRYDEMANWLNAQGDNINAVDSWPAMTLYLLNQYISTGEPSALAAFQQSYAQMVETGNIGGPQPGPQPQPEPGVDAPGAAENYNKFLADILALLDQYHTPLQGTIEPPSTSQSELEQALENKGTELLNRSYGYTPEEKKAMWVNAVNEFNLTEEEDLQRLQNQYEQYGLNSGAGELGGQAGNSLQTYFGKRAQALSNLSAKMGEYFASKASGDEQAAVKQAVEIQQQLYDQAHTDFVDTLNYLKTQDSLKNSDFQRIMQLVGLEDEQAQRNFLSLLGIIDRASQDYWLGVTTNSDQGATSQGLSNDTLTMLQNYVQIQGV